MIKTSLRIASLLSMLTLLVSACQPLPRVPSTQSAPAASSNANAEAANKAVVQRFYEEVVNQKHLEVMGKLTDSKFLPHDLGAPGDIGEVLKGMPDVKATVSLWVVEGDLVTAVVTFKGTHTGNWMGVAPTGKPVTFSIIDIWRVKGDMLTELWHNVPTSDMLAQISPASAK